MSKLVLALNEDLVHAMQDLAAWENRQEIALAAELLQLALEKAQPDRELQGRLASLSGRERQLANLLAQGMTNLQISQAMHISNETVRTHLRSIRRKMGLRSREQIREKLVNLPPALFGLE